MKWFTCNGFQLNENKIRGGEERSGRQTKPTKQISCLAVFAVFRSTDSIVVREKIVCVHRSVEETYLKSILHKDIEPKRVKSEQQNHISRIRNYFDL